VAVVQAEDMGLTEQHQVAVELGQRLAQQILVVVVAVTTLLSTTTPTVVQVLSSSPTQQSLMR
jgi:hypothetical protein